MSRTTLTPKPCGLLLMETTEDPSAKYFPLSQTIGDKYVFLFAMSRTIGDSLGRCFLSSRTIRDEYVFHFSMFNRLSDGYPGRAQKHTPLVRLSSTPTPFAGRLIGRMQYALHFRKKIRFPRVGVIYCLGQWRINTYFIPPCLIGYQIGTHVGRIEYAPCAFIVYPHTLCRAFGKAYAIRPYPAGRKIGFEGLAWDYV